ncbi:hypothetical protein CHLRE_01g013400v5 [Chlamydomonas reinhardtii]|uniref:GPI transamidase component PIG-S n=1 Tax=Chlamydomonas reinhardtii TaxID=3055 RepID=A0A2K3E5L1_CHLRE|nr:uncharacterized protein CHLRE_01g013400v5 [Chlamydomonas reinhardtii]PNW88081.1 hypothetical protein CHLRE_01g013400v5 [Chlamydomonas reinhardtii]
MAESERPVLPQSRRRLYAICFLVAYVVLVLPVWYEAVRVPRAPLPLEDIAALEEEVAAPLAGALASTVTVYVVCAGGTYTCFKHHELSPYAEAVGEEILRQLGKTSEQVPLLVRVVHDEKGACSTSSWESEGLMARQRRRDSRRLAKQGATGSASRRRGSSSGSSSSGGSYSEASHVGCVGLASSQQRLAAVLGAADRALDDLAVKELGGGDRAGQYVLFMFPDLWRYGGDLPLGAIGRRRFGVVRYPASGKPSQPAAVRLAALIAAPAFASHLGDPAGEAALSAAAAAADPAVAALLADEALPLPVSPAAQLHLSFSLCNAHPSPHSPHQEAPQASSSSDDGANSSGGKPAAASSFAAFSWDFSMFEAQFVAPWKNVLSAAARLTVSSQVLYFTPARVNGSWDRQRAAFTVPHAALPFFADSAWRLDPGRTGLPASAAGGAAGGGAMPYDLAAVHAGDRSTAVGEVVLPPMPPPHTPGRAAAEAAAAAALPRLLPPRAAASLPPAVLHFVLFAPPPGQRPLVLLGPDGQAAPANSFHVPGWGMLQVLNQVPPPGVMMAQVNTDNMEEFAREALTQLRSLLGLAAARRRLIQHNDLYAANGSSTSNKAGSSSTSTGSNSNGRGSNVPPPVGRIDVLTDLRSGLAPWEADALVRRRTRADVAAAAATLGSLARLLRQVPTLALPPAAGALVRDAVAALRRALAAVEAGSYVEASQAAQQARAWAEAAFSDPALSTRQNVPDTHLVGVYLPFCLPAAVPLLQALLHEVRRRRKKPVAAVDAQGTSGVGQTLSGEVGAEELVHTEPNTPVKGSES